MQNCLGYSTAGFDVSWEIALLCKMNKTVDSGGIGAQNKKWQGVVNFLRIHGEFFFSERNITKPHLRAIYMSLLKVPPIDEQNEKLSANFAG
jgi:hypothetical protein